MQYPWSLNLVYGVICEKTIVLVFIVFAFVYSGYLIVYFSHYHMDDDHTAFQSSLEEWLNNKMI